jgi:hypothetical protein
VLCCFEFCRELVCSVSHWDKSCPLNGKENYTIAMCAVPHASRRIRSLRATWSWVDQGWGFRKGSLRLHRVLSDDTRQIMSMTPEACKHTRETVCFDWPDVVAKGTNPKFYETATAVLASVREGDRIDVEACIGGGGGHRLKVEDLKIVVEFSRPWAYRKGMIMWRLAMEAHEFPHRYPVAAFSAAASSAGDGSQS